MTPQPLLGRTLDMTRAAGLDCSSRGALMTDTGLPRRDTTTPAPSPAASAEPWPQATAWTGWVIFASCMMFLVAVLQVVEGLVAIFSRNYYQVAPNGLVIHVSYTGWGWVHLLLGAVIGLSAAGVLVGNVAARTVGVILAIVSAVLNLLFLPAYPVWGMIAITLDVVVIYALTAHGKEMRFPAM
jgi:hypothetical protein